MIRFIKIGALLVSTMWSISCQQNGTGKSIGSTTPTKDSVSSKGPEWITRNIIQDRNGNIWMATFGGVFKYDGKAFTNITAGLGSVRFFSILEDRKGNLWFGSVGSGIYRYNGKSIEKYTADNGRLDDGSGCIYQDKAGNIWFGGSRGVSRYNGKSFQNFALSNDTIQEEKDEQTKKRHLYGVTTIAEDRTRTIWLGAGGVFRYDGRSFTPFTSNGIAFRNVRSIIADRKGNMWLGGADGLWRYDGKSIKKFTSRFVGHIIEDKKGNIWISSGSNGYQGWTLSWYHGDSLNSAKPTITTVVQKLMVFGIMEDKQGNIWFGDFDGAHRYDGKTITDFNKITPRQTSLPGLPM